MKAALCTLSALACFTLAVGCTALADEEDDDLTEQPVAARGAVPPSVELAVVCSGFVNGCAPGVAGARK